MPSPSIPPPLGLTTKGLGSPREGALRGGYRGEGTGARLGSGRSAILGLAWDYLFLGQYEKGLEAFDKAIRLSPHHPSLPYMVNAKSWAYLWLKQYDQAIVWARRAIAVGTNEPYPYASLSAALALTGHEAEARDALQRFLALPSSGRLRTIAAWRTYQARYINASTDPRVLESYERTLEGLRKAGMPEE
jgi:adenylate cyclase